MTVIRNDLLAVNYRRFVLTFGTMQVNPFKQFGNLVSDSLCQAYALLLFNDFLPLAVDDPTTVIPNDIRWMHFEKVNFQGAIM